MLEALRRMLWRDIARHRARSLLVVLAVAIGLVGAGAVLDSWALVRRATEVGFRGSLPVSATLGVDGVDPALLAEVRRLPGVAAARGRRVLAGAVQGHGAWTPAQVVMLDDFTDASMARLQPDAGRWPPADGALVVERSSLELAAVTVGEPVLLRIGRGEPHALAMAGVVRDVSVAPGWMEHAATCYATPATLARLGAPATFDELQVRVADARADRDAVRRIAATVAAQVARRGAHVRFVDVPEPGEHVHAAQMDSLLMTQGAFGVLALFVCALLVVNLFTAMLTGQAREIGVLKVLGARGAQIAGVYLSQAAVLGTAAALLALPLAIVIGRAYAGFRAEMLNFPVDGLRIPAWAIALQVAVGVLLPVLAAAVPVRRACRQSVGAALRDIGIVADGRPLAARRWLALGGMPRSVLLAVGNAFRRRERLVLTVLAIALGGAVHLGAANLRQAVIGSMDRLFSAQHFDASLRLADPRPIAALEAAARANPGVARAEAWRSRHATIVRDGGQVGGTVTLLGLPPASTLMQPHAVSGRWLRDDDARMLVISRALQRQQPDWVRGGAVRLDLDGTVAEWRIAGIVDAGPAPLAYVNRATLSADDGLATSLAIVARTRGRSDLLELIQALRGDLADAGMPVAESQTTAESRTIVEDHLLMVVQFLGAMGTVMVVVGAVGLASTMSLAVLERTREIGVLRALGARDLGVLGIVQVEGLAIVALAWLVSIPLSVPMSVLLANAFGRVMFPLPTPWWPHWTTSLQWLAVMVPTAIVACMWPAWRAMRVTTARALSYE